METKNKYWTIRHGQSENNLLNLSNTHDYNLYHLTDLGRKQSEEAGKILMAEKIDIIYTSPFLRTKETAEIVARSLGIHEVKEDVRLSELREGNPDGQPLQNLPRTWDNFEEGGESYGELYSRIQNLIHDIESVHMDKIILLVSHATPQNMIEAFLVSSNLEEVKARFLSIQLSKNHYKPNAVPYKI
jgi:broad specificity phosphatase PhoE